MSKNHQTPTKPDYASSDELQVHSIFPTIQGEGPFAGKRAVFLRLAHCNLQCPGCDTEYTEGARTMTVDEIVGDVVMKGLRYELVVITGGEPFRQDIHKLIERLQQREYTVQIETNGVLCPPTLPECVIVVSPKTHFVHPEIADHAAAYKYVLHADEVNLTDGLPLKALHHKNRSQVARPPEGFAGPIYVQPMDTGDEQQDKRNLDACVDGVVNHGYTLCLQQHKIIGVE